MWLRVARILNDVVSERGLVHTGLGREWYEYHGPSGWMPVESGAMADLKMVGFMALAHTHPRDEMTKSAKK